MLTVLIEGYPAGDPTAFTEFPHNGLDGWMNFDFSVDQFGLVAIHFLKNGEQQILAQFDGRLQHHVKHLAIVLAVVVILRQRLDVKNFVK